MEENLEKINKNVRFIKRVVIVIAVCSVVSTVVSTLLQLHDSRAYNRSKPHH